MRNLRFCSAMATALAVEASRWRRMFCSLFLVAAAIGALGALGSSGAIGQRVGDNAFHLGKIAPWVVEHTANAQQAEFLLCSLTKPT
jgi:hypothetical protein